MTPPLDTPDTADTAPFAQLARKIAPDGTLRRAWPLHGGVSARVTACEIAYPDGRTETLIARQHGAADLARNANIASDEFTLLLLLHTAGLPVPMPRYLDLSGETFAAPVVVIEYLVGAPAFSLDGAPALISQLAAQLAAIHHAAIPPRDLAFLPRQDALWAAKLNARPALLDGSLEEGRLRDALEAVWPLAQTNAPCLLHGDFWPGNILWRDGRLVGVLDWEDAATGDPLADLANSRLEVLWAFGEEAMDDFTRSYLAVSPLDGANLPYWDLCAALRPANKLSDWITDAIVGARMRARHRMFVAQAFAQLAAR